MAITKVYAVRNQLKRAVEYAANEEKTSLDNIINYATNPAKTEQRLFETAINCTSVDTAHKEMVETKRKFGKEDKVLAYHYIQSFRPCEVTPELAHKIGVEFAEECFGDRFEVVVGTHLDKGHLHNHVVVNSVSFIDGGKLRSTPQSYYNIIRKTSDRLCREYELSVIENPQRKGLHYAEWKAQKEDKPTIRGQMRIELDEIILRSYTMKDFWRNIEKQGYIIHRKGENIKHTSVIPPFGKRPVRLDSLGKDYTEEEIQQRIMAARYGVRTAPPSQVKRTYRLNGSLKTYKRKKLKGFIALYYHYLYLFGKIKKRKAPQQVSFFMREELIKFDRYQKQFKFLYTHNIETIDELKKYNAESESQINELVEQRQQLYKEKEAADEPKKEEISQQISAVNEQLKICRADVRICKKIFEDATRIKENLDKVQVLQTQTVKEGKHYEHKRRSR